MNRRTFFQYCGKIFLPLTTYGCNRQPKKSLENVIFNQDEKQTRIQSTTTPANWFFKDFPEKIPGAGKIEKYEFIGSKYHMIHIKQMHVIFEKETALQLSKEIEDREQLNFILGLNEYKWNIINKIQKDIYTILEYLRKNYEITEIRAEGFTKQISKEQLEQLYMIRLSKILDECCITHEEKNENFEKYGFAPGADVLMGLQGKLKILPGEDSELNKQAIESVKKDKEHQVIYNPREDFLLSLIKKPLEVAVYGGCMTLRIMPKNMEFP